MYYTFIYDKKKCRNDIIPLITFFFFYKLYLAAQNSNHKFLGCFLGDDLLSFGDENYILTSASPQSCSELCIGKQYNFFNIKNE